MAAKIDRKLIMTELMPGFNSRLLDVTLLDTTAPRIHIEVRAIPRSGVGGVAQTPSMGLHFVAPGAGPVYVGGPLLSPWGLHDGAHSTVGSRSV